MQILNLTQGSPEWKETRFKHFTASEAPAMMGVSKYMKRDELLAMKATGEEKEIDPFTQKLFDRGHAAEAAIRPHIEAIIGDELYPATGSETMAGLPLLASFDGLTMDQMINFEHKLWNEKLAAHVEAGILEPHYMVQLDQQMLLSGATKTIFVVSDGTPDKMVFMWYETNGAKENALIAGWIQFQADLESYQHTPTAVKAEAQTLMELPALNIQINGSVTNSNLAAYQESTIAFIKSINTDLKTDEDFATAESTVKFCGEAEKKLDLVKAQALEQTADISVLFRTIDSLKEEMRSKRLVIEKLVKAEKQNIKMKIAGDAHKILCDYVADLNNSFGLGDYVAIASDFNSSMKGKKTIDSLQSAANDELARCKILAKEQHDTVQKNLSIVPEENILLFSDLSSIVLKDHDDFKLLVKSRIDADAERIKAAQDAEEERQAAAIKEDQESVPVVAESKGSVSDDCIPNGVISESEANNNFQDRMKGFEPELKQSFIDNGIGKQTAGKVAKLICDGKIKNLTINMGAA